MAYEWRCEIAKDVDTPEERAQHILQEELSTMKAAFVECWSQANE